MISSAILLAGLVTPRNIAATTDRILFTMSPPSLLENNMLLVSLDATIYEHPTFRIFSQQARPVKTQPCQQLQTLIQEWHICCSGSSQKNLSE